jgi:hypothetical protein
MGGCPGSERLWGGCAGLVAFGGGMVKFYKSKTALRAPPVVPVVPMAPPSLVQEPPIAA